MTVVSRRKQNKSHKIVLYKWNNKYFYRARLAECELVGQEMIHILSPFISLFHIHLLKSIRLRMNDRVNIGQTQISAVLWLNMTVLNLEEGRV